MQARQCARGGIPRALWVAPAALGGPAAERGAARAEAWLPPTPARVCKSRATESAGGRAVPPVVSAARAARQPASGGVLHCHGALLGAPHRLDPVLDVVQHRPLR